MTTQSFFAELNATFLINPFNHAEHVIGKACVALEQSMQSDDEVYIAFIKSIEQGCGDASAALRKVTEMADSHQVNLRLFIHPIRSAAKERKLTLTRTELVSWYKRNGFEQVSWGYMLRRHNTQ